MNEGITDNEKYMRRLNFIGITKGWLAFFYCDYAVTELHIENLKIPFLLLNVVNNILSGFAALFLYSRKFWVFVFNKKPDTKKPARGGLSLWGQNYSHSIVAGGLLDTS